MKYATLILLAGCIHGTTVWPQEGESDVDGMDAEGTYASTIEPLAVLDGMAGMGADGAGGAMDAAVGLGGDGGGGGGGSPEGPDGGAGGTGGGEGPEPALAAVGESCRVHSDCAPPHPQEAYCYLRECIDRGDYDWIVDGGNCDLPWDLICQGWESGYRCVEVAERRLCAIP